MRGARAIERGTDLKAKPKDRDRAHLDAAPDQLGGDTNLGSCRREEADARVPCVVWDPPRHLGGYPIAPFVAADVRRRTPVGRGSVQMRPRDRKRSGRARPPLEDKETGDGHRGRGNDWGSLLVSVTQL